MLSSSALILTTLLAFLLAPPLHAQVVGGTISGTVVDATGAAIPNAQVLVHNEETGNERHLTTGPDGRYSAPSVPVGTYTVTVTASGFSDQTRTGVPLSVGQSQNVPITLSVSGVSESVIVRDEPPVINVSTQQTAGLVDARQVKELPLNGRSYDQLVTLNPATVNYTAQRSGSVGTSNSSVGKMFAVSSRRPQDNLYLLNGVEYTSGLAHQRHARAGRSEPTAGGRGGARVQRHHRHLLGGVRQAARRAGLDRNGVGDEQGARLGV